MLNDRIVAVVGGSTGIGRATAIACGAAGAAVIVGARNIIGAQAVADEAQAAGAPATLALDVDVRTSASVDAFIGAIVNVGSVGSFTGLVGQGIYAASKHAVWALTRSAAVENAGRGIRINMIAPAGTETPMLHRVLQGNEAAFRAAAAMHPIGRFGQPAESAAAIVWLLSDAASFVCGQSIGVDGGYSATLGFNPQAATGS